MASKAHEFISQMIGMAMRQRGYTIVSSDADTSKISDIKYKTPPTLKRHRPDLIGINKKTGKICIGEAKTRNDLISDRSKEQFEDFSKIITTTNDEVELIIGIPQSSEKKIISILKELELREKKNIFVLKIPDKMLPS